MKAGFDNLCVILHEPRYPENIGAAARCCRNMGIPQLIVGRLLGRQELRSRETKMIRGFCQQILWAIENKKHFKQ